MVTALASCSIQLPSWFPNRRFADSIRHGCTWTYSIYSNVDLQTSYLGFGLVHASQKDHTSHQSGVQDVVVIRPRNILVCDSPWPQNISNSRRVLHPRIVRRPRRFKRASSRLYRWQISVALGNSYQEHQVTSRISTEWDFFLVVEREPSPTRKDCNVEIS